MISDKHEKNSFSANKTLFREPKKRAHKTKSKMMSGKASCRCHFTVLEACSKPNTERELATWDTLCGCCPRQIFCDTHQCGSASCLTFCVIVLFHVLKSMIVDSVITSAVERVISANNKGNKIELMSLVKELAIC